MEINLDEKEIYYTGDLNRQQFEVLLSWLKKNDTDWEDTNIEDIQNLNGYDSLKYSDDSWGWELNEKQTKNAKELFYTLENIQVDCRELSEEQIKEMADVFESKGYCYFQSDKKFSLNIIDDNSYLHIYEGEIIIDCMVEGLNEITYEKFMELFGENEKLPPYKEAPLKWNYETLVGDNQVVIKHTKEFSPSKKQVLKYLLKKDIILTPKQYKKLWKKS